MGFRVLPIDPSKRTTERVDLRAGVDVMADTVLLETPQSAITTTAARAAGHYVPPAPEPVFRALWTKVYKKSIISLVTMIVSMGAIYSYYSVAPADSASAVIASIPKAEPVRINVIDPRLDDSKTAPAASANIAPIKSLGFDLMNTVKEIKSGAEPRSLTYVKGPKDFGESNYASVLRESSNLISKRPNLPLRLQSVSGSDGRFLAEGSNLEWQAGFKISDPEANINRASSYLKYLDSMLGQNSAQGLTSKSLSPSNLSSSLEIAK